MPSSSRTQLSPAQQERALIAEYDIEFLGTELQRRWPDRYAATFAEARDIRGCFFEDLKKGSNTLAGRSLSLPVRVLQNRTLELRRRAVLPSCDPVNERTLRWIENLVFAGLTSDVKCETCRGFKRIAEFQAVPADENEARRLERRRLERVLCRCQADDWDPDQFDDKGEALFFVPFLENPVQYDPGEDLVDRGIKTRQPDLVMGLKTTKSIAHFQKEFDSRHGGRPIRHSPFKKAGLVYPFIVVESKSEEGSPGFEAIQRQSAFPIRECLRLQQRLQQASGQPLDPLVWFFSYQADEWRLSAAVVNDGKYQIYDLWINRVLDPSGVLQLLLLVDFIADWARDMYRLKILGCLAGGTDRVKRFRGDSHDTYASQRTLPPALHLSDQSPVLSQEHGNIPTSSSPVPISNEVSMSGAFSWDPLTEDVAHPFLRWTDKRRVQPSPGKDMTIRHANMVDFTFIHLCLPESPKDLSAFLLQCMARRPQSAADVAESIETVLLNAPLTASTTFSWIEQVRCLWLRLSPTTEEQDVDVVVRAVFRFRTYVRESDWQIVREVTCISCTRSAIEALANLTRRDLRLCVSSLQPATAQDTPKNSTAAFGHLISLTGIFSGGAAFESITLYLDSTTSSWVHSDSAWAMASLFEYLVNSRNHSTEIPLDITTTTMAVIPKRIPREFLRSLALRLPLKAAAKAILARSRSDNDAHMPRWCLMVMEEVDFMDNKAVGEMVAYAIEHGEVVLLDNDPDGILTWARNVPLDSFGDVTFIQWWLDHLM